jgi:hypothetical protein
MVRNYRNEKNTVKDNDHMKIMNLHDVFLTASMCRKYMDESPLEDDLLSFAISQRGRFERLWITFIFVVIEAWQSKYMSSAQNHVKNYVPADVTIINDLLKKAINDHSLDKMRDVRDYMCHRDKREYWNKGRIAVFGQLVCNDKIFRAFGDMFLNYFEKIRAKP